MRNSKFVFLSVAVAGILIDPAQRLTGQPSADTPVTLQSSTQLVLIPTVVHDKSDAHIPNLKKEDFLIKENGKPQSIAVFEEVRTDSIRLRRSGGENGTFSNFDPSGNEYHRLKIIVLDFVNTPFADQANARQELLKFLAGVAAAGEPMCLLALTGGGLRLVQGFTDDPKLLAGALRRVPSNNSPLIYEPTVQAGDFPGSGQLTFLLRIIRANLEEEAKMAAVVRSQAASVTVQALQQIATAFRGMPGRKSLIWASSGFPFAIRAFSPKPCDLNCSSHDQYGNLWRQMNDAQIAVYSVDLRPGTVGMSLAQNPGGVRPSDLGDPQFDSDAQTKRETEGSSDTLRLFAENTGGKAFLGGGSLAESFRQATQDDNSYYMLGYYVSRDSKPGWNPITVTTTRKGARVRCRNGYLFSKDTSTASAQPDVQLALNSAFDFVGLPLSVTWSGRDPGKAPGQTRAQFDLVMPANVISVDESDQNHIVVDIVAVARNLNGEVVGELHQRIENHLKADALEQIRNNGITYRSGFQLPPGEYHVRFVVRDSLVNHIGSVTAPIRVSP